MKPYLLISKGDIVTLLTKNLIVLKSKTGYAVSNPHKVYSWQGLPTPRKTIL